MAVFTPLTSSTKSQLLTNLCDQFEDAIFILDAHLRYLSVNATYEMMIGYSESFLLGRPLGVYAADFLSEEERAVLQDINTRLDSSGFYESNFAMVTRYGQTLNCRINFRSVCVDTAKFYVGIVRDISSEVKDRRKVKHLLNYDQLTGLPNRKIFLSQTDKWLLNASNEVVIVRFNIDRFRNLASILGCQNINLLIKTFVKRIEALELEHLQCFSHFGGDDFALLFVCSDALSIKTQLKTLIQMCERPFSVADHVMLGTAIYFHISVGVSYFPRDSHLLSDLVSKAEKALFYMKQRGGGDIQWYEPNNDDGVVASLQLEADLRVAAEEGQFVAHYQPKVRLDTGAITGFEALVRWQHPTRGLLSPIDFIDAIITNKLSFTLFYQMSLHIAQQLCVWQSLGFDHHICINADATEFSHSRFYDVVSQLIEEYDLQPHRLHIEITESSLIQRHASVNQQLYSLKALGVRLALDDFGTGYASLSYLQEYPFDFIKIDKSFISKIVDNKTQYAIVKAILMLANALNMQVVAEGIETEQQKDLLLKMGCEYGQGYWFGRPVTAEVATQMLLDQQSAK